ncbi:cation:dicarboxylate symporter family transporter [Alicyclobacillus macrosporangiidus]|uniref:cation:dicarboxylate symporter family transporter n=1 Tax=Alicyclobacillus macrosporangiidus TaxID=392015 RepID=UPI0026EA2F8E|nr:cation:dicarboxylase symporter family transporter [Alicyclobacillus macrosporangiidus]
MLLALVIGFGLGLEFPKNAVVQALALSGTYFPKTVVTFAAVVIFFLLSTATARLIMVHKERAGQFFGRIFVMYLALGLISLIWVTIFIWIVIGLPITAPGTKVPTFATWLLSVVRTFKTIISQQPLLQTLVASILVGWVTAAVKPLNVVAHGMIRVGDGILKVFKWLLWYYPIMIGCLAISIPLKFGKKGVAYYGQTVLWLVAVTLIWCLIMIVVTKLVTKRTWKQMMSYFWTVYPTGFGTGGSYDTLAVNLVSAERDLELQPQVAEVSIVFGTVLNKNAATMAVLLCTITVCWMLHVPVSLTDILLLVLPIWILGLESPGVPGGAGFFMSPIVAVILNVPDPGVFVTTFVAMYSGLIPMLTTATNTTNDGFIGAMLEDRFARSILTE